MKLYEMCAPRNEESDLVAEGLEIFAGCSGAEIIVDTGATIAAAGAIESGDALGELSRLMKKLSATRFRVMDTPSRILEFIRHSDCH